MPSNKIIYLHTVDLNERCKKTLQLLQSVHSQGLNLEKLYGFQIWSVRVSDEARLLLTLTMIQGELCWLVLEYLPTHGYETSRFLQPNVLKRFLEKHHATLNKLTPYDFQPVENLENRTTSEPATFQRAHYYNHEFICLNNPQEEILKKPFPLVLSGMPGSGKTCIGFILLENFLKQNKSLNIRVLYISLSPTLAANKQKEWNEATVTSDIASQGLQFLSIDQWMETQGSQRVGLNEFTSWFKQQKSTFDATCLYEEFKCISVFSSEADYIAQSGTRNSLYHTESDKKQAYAFYQKYAVYLTDNHQVDLFFHRFIPKNKYDFIFVDESQNLSHMQLSCLLESAHQYQICFAMDTNQNMQKGVSTRPYLLQLIAQTTHQPVTHCNLLQTFRNPPRVVELANAVLRVKNVLVGGVADSNEYTQTVAIDDQDKPGFVQWCDKVTAELINIADHPSTAIIVNSQEEKEAANALFNSPLIFTREEIQGLQFETIILFKPFDDPALKIANKAMPDDMADRSLKQHRPKDKNDQTSLEYVQSLNALYTSITRSSDSVYILSQEQHEYKKLFTHLKQATQQKTSHSVPKPKTEATEEEWEAKAVELEQNNHAAQAAEIRRRKLKKSRVAKVPQAPINVACSSTDDLSELDKFAINPTSARFAKILNAEDASTLLYRTKLKSGLTLFETIRANIIPFIETFTLTDESLLFFKILLKDPRVSSKLLLSHDIFSHDLHFIFQSYSKSAVGALILLTSMLAQPVVFRCLANKKTREVFWKYASALLRFEAGRDLVGHFSTFEDQPMKSLTKTSLHANQLFQFLCIDDLCVKALLKLVQNDPALLQGFNKDSLLAPFYHGHCIFSLLCSSQTRITLLFAILNSNPAIIKLIPAEQLLTKYCYRLDLSSNVCQIKTQQKMLANFREIELTPFHQLCISHFEIGFKLLKRLQEANQFIKKLTVTDLYPVPTYNTIECRGPLFNLASISPAELLDVLVTERADLMLSLPPNAFFAKPHWSDKLAAPYICLLASRDSLDYNLEILWKMINLRKEFIIECAASISDPTDIGFEVLTTSTVGRQILELIYDTDKNLFRDVNWTVLITPFQDYGLPYIIKGSTPFYYLMKYAPKLLEKLVDTYPIIYQFLTTATLFTLLPSNDKHNTQPSSAFMSACLSSQSHSLLRKIILKPPILAFAKVQHFMIEYHSGPNSVTPFENLCVTDDGAFILRCLFENNLSFDCINENTLTRLTTPCSIVTSEKNLPLIYWLVQREMGCHFLRDILVKKPSLNNPTLQNIILNRIPGTTIKICDILAKSQEGQVVLQLINSQGRNSNGLFASGSQSETMVPAPEKVGEAVLKL